MRKEIVSPRLAPWLWLGGVLIWLIGLCAWLTNTNHQVSVFAGTANTIAKFTSAGAIADSAVTDDGTTFSIAAGKLTLTESTGATSITTTSGGADTLTALWNASGATSGNHIAVAANNTGTLNATAAVRNAYGVKITNTASRNSGSNTVTNFGIDASCTGTTGISNIAAHLTASGGGVSNFAIQTDAGDVTLNTTSGNTLIGTSTVQKVISNAVPTVNHGSLTASASNAAGRVTGIGANTAVTLTFGSSGFGTTAYCFAQVEGGAQGIYVTASATAPVFNCYNETTSVAANCNDFSYLCVGH